MVLPAQHLPISTMFSTLLSLLALTSTCLAQLNLTSCTSTDYDCISNRTRADQALLEFPNWVTYPIQSDHFYDTPANISNATQPGTILKLEMYTNVTGYDIPPGTSLSRFMYTSLDNFGAIVPATAAILWPFTPKSFNGSDTFPLVAWAHGTTGIDRQCAVSNTRNLQYDFRSVFTLAKSGYAVVMADYVGLGSDNFFNYLAYKLHANDVVYSVTAAQSVFSELSANWVSFGHSEGGGVAWAVGERQAIDPIPGFLGTIAAAPPPFPIGITANVSNSVFTAFLSFTISHLYGLNLSAIFNPVPLQALQLVQSIGGCNDAGYAAFATFTAEDIYSDVTWPMSQVSRSVISSLLYYTDHPRKAGCGLLQRLLRQRPSPRRPHAHPPRKPRHSCRDCRCSRWLQRHMYLPRQQRQHRLHLRRRAEPQSLAVRIATRVAAVDRGSFQWRGGGAGVSNEQFDGEARGGPVAGKVSGRIYEALGHNLFGDVCPGG